jgi:hypothetical protein
MTTRICLGKLSGKLPICSLLGILELTYKKEFKDFDKKRI